MELQNKLLDLRKERGMTQDELAEALFVSRQTIYKWETGRAQPDVDRLKQICEFFNVSADELLKISFTDDNKGEAASAAAPVPPDGGLRESAEPGAAIGPSVNQAPPAGIWKKRAPRIPICAAAALLCAALIFVFLRPPKEIRQAIALGVVPTEMAGGLSRPVTERELLSLLLNICQKENGGASPALTAAASAATNEQLAREKAAYWTYCAHIWTKLDPNADLFVETDPPLISQRNVYEDLNILGRSSMDGMDAPWEGSLCRELAKIGKLFEQYDGTKEMDDEINAILFGPYYTSVAFCLAQKSFANEKPLMECHGDSFCPKDKLTREDAIIAAYRLYGSW